MTTDVRALRTTALTILAAVVMTMGVAVRSSAQEPASAFDKVSWTGVKSGDTIILTDVDGRGSTRTFVRADPDQLVLAGSGPAWPTIVRADRIRQVDVAGPSKAKQGALIGLSTGAALGFVAAAAGEKTILSGPALDAMAAGIFGGFGALIGGVVGASFHGPSRVIYQRPAAVGPGAALSVVPMLSPGSRGVRFTLSF